LDYYEILNSELTVDPRGIGYLGLSNADAAMAFNLPRNVERDYLSGSEIYNAIAPTEFTALADPQKQLVRDIFSLGDVIDVRTNTNVRAVLLAIFNAQSTTRANLAAAIATQKSRPAELGILEASESDVARARSM
jgi:hypothetical protein